MTDTINHPARCAVNAAHDLTIALLAALTPADREKAQLLTTAGASPAVTVRWIDGRVELRVGLTLDDEPPLTLLALAFGKTAPGHAPAGAAH